MKKFICKISVFLLIPIIYSIIAIFTMPSLLSIQNGPSTKQQISSSFENAIKKDYDQVILGNSRVYRGLNPDYFSSSTFNFSHDNDSFNQIYYKLMFLLNKNKNINYIILGIDYFQFSFKSDTRNYAYADFFNTNYLSDFKNSALKYKFDYYFDTANPKKLISLRPKKHKPFYKENGQYIKHGLAKENDIIQRDINRLKFQENYFKKIIELCRSKNIQTFMVMLPTRDNELKSYTKEETKKFNFFIESFTDKKNIFYLNYSEIAGFNTIDYTDITHFNESAANRFSEILNKDICSLIKQ